jgi:hypothetical protein
MNERITDTVVDNEEKNIQKTTDTNVIPTDNYISTDSPVNFKGMGKGSNPNSKKNLMLVRTSEEARERGRKGGIKSGEVRKAKKTMRETLENALRIELSPAKLAELGAETSLMNGETSVLSAIIASTIREAINGDTKAIQFVRDSIGEQPVNKSEVTQEIVTKEDTDLMDNLRKSLIS